MSKKTSMIMIFILLFSILTGCIDEKKPTEQKNNELINSPPMAIITAPEKAYFGDLIEFDASESYDEDGEIISYRWDFGDDQTLPGEIVEHSYKFQGEFNIDYPIVFPVLLYILDDDKKLVVTQHYIMLYPREYNFYLGSGVLTTQEASISSDKTKASLGKFKSNPPGEVFYEFDQPIKIHPCSWDLVLFIEKTRFTFLNSVKLTFYNETYDEIISMEKPLGNLNVFWKEQKIIIDGEIDELTELNSLKLTFFGFSIGERVSILYGGESSSCICFNFTGFYSPII